MDNASHELESLESLEHIEVRFGLSSVIIFLLLELTQVKKTHHFALNSKYQALTAEQGL